MTTTTADRRRTALALAPGQATWVRSKGEYAAYLRRLPGGNWAVLAGWRVEEGFDSDYLSECPVAGLEGVPQAYRNYDFGADFEAAYAYYLECVEALPRRRVVRELSLPAA